MPEQQPPAKILDPGASEAVTPVLLRQPIAPHIAATRETGLALIGTGEASDLVAEGTPFGPAPLALATLRGDEERVIAPFDRGLAELGRTGVSELIERDWLRNLVNV